VELHVSIELSSEGVDTVTLTPDKESEVHHAPAPNTMRGGLFLGDRMFFIKAYLAQIIAHGGSFIVKAKGIINPLIRHAYIYSTDPKQLFDLSRLSLDWKPYWNHCERLLKTRLG
jgi:hypothetical protein